MSDELKDWRGTPITVGSLVVYPGTSGSATWVNEAEVLAVEYYSPYPTREARPRLKVQRTNTTGYMAAACGPSYLTAISRVTVLP